MYLELLYLFCCLVFAFDLYLWVRHRSHNRDNRRPEYTLLSTLETESIRTSSQINASTAQKKCQQDEGTDDNSLHVQEEEEEETANTTAVPSNDYNANSNVNELEAVATYDYVVIGAGPAGLAASSELLKQTMEFQVNKNDDGEKEYNHEQSISVLLVERGEECLSSSTWGQVCETLQRSRLVYFAPDCVHVPLYALPNAPIDLTWTQSMSMKDERFAVKRPLREREILNNEKSLHEEEESSTSTTTRTTTTTTTRTTTTTTTTTATCKEHVTVNDNSTHVKEVIDKLRVKEILNSYTPYPRGRGVGGTSLVDWGLELPSLTSNNAVAELTSDSNSNIGTRTNIIMSNTTEANHFDNNKSECEESEVKSHPMSVAFCDAVRRLEKAEITSNTRNATRVKGDNNNAEISNNNNTNSCKKYCNGEGSSHTFINVDNVHVHKWPLRIDCHGRRVPIVTSHIFTQNKNGANKSSDLSKRCTSVQRETIEQHESKQKEYKRQYEPETLSRLHVLHKHKVVDFILEEEYEEQEEEQEEEEELQRTQLQESQMEIRQKEKIEQECNRTGHNLMNNNNDNKDTSYTSNNDSDNKKFVITAVIIESTNTIASNAVRNKHFWSSHKMPNVNLREKLRVNVRRGVVIAGGVVCSPRLVYKMLTTYKLNTTTITNTTITDNNNYTANTTTFIKDALALPIIFQAHRSITLDACNINEYKTWLQWLTKEEGAWTLPLTEAVASIRLPECGLNVVLHIFCFAFGGRDAKRYYQMGWDRLLGCFAEAMTFLVVVDGIDGLDFSINLEEDHSSRKADISECTMKRCEYNEIHSTTSSATEEEEEEQQLLLSELEEDQNEQSRCSNNNNSNNDDNNSKKNTDNIFSLVTEEMKRVGMRPLHMASNTHFTNETINVIRTAFTQGILLCHQIAETAPLSHLLTGNEAIDGTLLSSVDAHKALELTKLLHLPPNRVNKRMRQRANELMKWAEEIAFTQDYMHSYINVHAYWLGFGSGSCAPFVHSNTPSRYFHESCNNEILSSNSNNNSNNDYTNIDASLACFVKQVGNCVVGDSSVIHDAIEEHWAKKQALIAGNNNSAMDVGRAAARLLVQETLLCNTKNHDKRLVNREKKYQ